MKTLTPYRRHPTLKGTQTICTRDRPPIKRLRSARSRLVLVGTKGRFMSIARLCYAKEGRLFRGRMLWAVGLVALPAMVFAVQNSEDDSSRKEPGELEVVIKREALKLTDPRTYSVSMHLDAVRAVELTAPVDGYVRSVSAKPGQ